MDAAVYASGDGPAIGEMAVAAFLIETHWTWQDYLDAPVTLVKSMMAIMNARADVSKEAVRDMERSEESFGRS